MAQNQKIAYKSPFPANDNLRAHMLLLARAYCKANKTAGGEDLPLKTLGERAIRDSRFFLRLESNEGTFQATKYDEVLIWFAMNWPKDTPWPGGVPRPTKQHFATAAE